MDLTIRSLHCSLHLLILFSVRRPLAKKLVFIYHESDVAFWALSSMQFIVNQRFGFVGMGYTPLAAESFAMVLSLVFCYMKL
jgi:hypothetical protein